MLPYSYLIYFDNRFILEFPYEVVANSVERVKNLHCFFKVKMIAKGILKVKVILSECVSFMGELNLNQLAT